MEQKAVIDYRYDHLVQYTKTGVALLSTVRGRTLGVVDEQYPYDMLVIQL